MNGVPSAALAGVERAAPNMTVSSLRFIQPLQSVGLFELDSSFDFLSFPTVNGPQYTAMPALL